MEASDGFKKREQPPKKVRQEIKEFRSGTLSRGTRRPTSDISRVLNETFKEMFGN